MQGAANSIIDQTRLFAQQVYDVYRSIPEAASIFQITSPTGGFGGMVTKPWSERTKTAQQLPMESMGPLSGIPGIRVILADAAGAAGRWRFPGRSRDRVGSRAGTAERVRRAVGEKAFASGMFIFADADLKFDQPQTEVVFDRDKLRSQGVDLSQAGRDCRRCSAGTTSTDSASRGAATRSSRRSSATNGSRRISSRTSISPVLEARRVALVGVTRPLRAAITWSRCDVRDAQDDDRAAGAQEVSAAECGPHPGRDSTARAAGSSLDVPRTGSKTDPAGARIHHRLCRRVASAAHRGQVPRCVPAVGDVDHLVLAAQFESFRDPFIILAGLVPLAALGALLFSFLGLTTLNIYSQVGLITLVGLVAKNGIPIVQFANHLQETGIDKLRAVIDASATRLRPILMTTAATVVGHTPLIFAAGPGAGARNSIGIMLVSGMIIGTVFTLFVVPSIYMLVARTRAATVREPEISQDPVGEFVNAV